MTVAVGLVVEQDLEVEVVGVDVVVEEDLLARHVVDDLDRVGLVERLGGMAGIVIVLLTSKPTLAGLPLRRPAVEQVLGVVLGDEEDLEVGRRAGRDALLVDVDLAASVTVVSVRRGGPRP